jgi:hypothetical protein
MGRFEKHNTMKLSEFIVNTVNDICKAAREIETEQRKFTDPVLLGGEPQEIEFDLLITTKGEKMGTVGAGIFLYDVVQFGGRGKKTVTNENVNRVKFKIPIRRIGVLDNQLRTLKKN